MLNINYVQVGSTDGNLKEIRATCHFSTPSKHVNRLNVPI